MSFVPVSGTDGRLVSQGVIVYGIKTWKLSKKTTPIPIPNFESPTDADGNVWPYSLRGLSGANVSFDGQVNTDPTDSTDSGYPSISNGLTVTLDLYESKESSWGYEGLEVLITDFDSGTNIENQAASFTASGVIQGICPKSGTIA